MKNSQGRNPVMLLKALCIMQFIFQYRAYLLLHCTLFFLSFCLILGGGEEFNFFKKEFGGKKNADGKNES